MPNKPLDWETPTGQKKIASLARKLAKDDPAFTLLLFSRKLDLNPARRKWYLEDGRKVTVLDVQTLHKQRLWKFLEKAPSKTHESLAHELFDLKKGHELKHIKSFFGHKLGDKLLADYIGKNASLSPNELAAEFGMTRTNIVAYAKRAKSVRWQRWCADNLQIREVSTKTVKQNRDRARAVAKGSGKPKTIRKLARAARKHAKR